MALEREMLAIDGMFARRMKMNLGYAEVPVIDLGLPAQPYLDAMPVIFDIGPDRFIA
ncbi:hypothetical protein D3C76_1626510 [compost metagenome]